MTPERIRHVLEAPLATHGPFPAGWDQRLAEYLELLRSWNEKVNLVSRASMDRVVEGQLLPCLAAVLVVPAGERLAVLDVGTGGGLPGIPLKILRPEIRLDLVDARRKKTEFLTEAVRQLGLKDTEVHWCRIEAPTPELVARAPFSRVFARAVGAEEVLQAAIPPLLAQGGGAWTFVAPGSSGDLGWPEASPVTALRELARRS